MKTHDTATTLILIFSCLFCGMMFGGVLVGMINEKPKEQIRWGEDKEWKGKFTKFDERELREIIERVETGNDYDRINVTFTKDGDMFAHGEKK